MPFSEKGVDEAGLGLALSGGGFRATLFHIGSLWRLNECALLPRLTRISSVSGGSITSGRLAVTWKSLRWRDGRAEDFVPQVVEPLRAFCRRLIDIPAVVLGMITPGRSAADYVASAYRAALFGTATLQDLPEAPRFVFNATNLQTGRDFRFSRPYIGDYELGLIYDAAVPLSVVVAASSAFPPVLSPVTLPAPGRFVAVDGSRYAADAAYTATLRLTDGGAYDNLGLQTLENRCRTILVSDAGAPFTADPKPCRNWLSQTRRALDIATDQARAQRKSELVAAYDAARQVPRPAWYRDGAYWGIDTDIADYGAHMPCLAAWIAPLARMRTRLNPFSAAEQGALINWGYALCDAALRRYAPQLLTAADIPAAAWPCPQQALDSGG